MTVLWWMRFPEAWPEPESDLQLASMTHDGAEFWSLVRIRTGKLSVTLGDGQTVAQTWTFPRMIGIEGQAALIIFRLQPDGAVDLFVNGFKLSSVPPGSDDTVEFAQVTWTLKGRALEEPNAVEACQAWIEWRSKWSRPRRIRLGRRQKTEAEIQTELAAAVDALELHLAGVRAGNLSLVGDIASRLRALVYWDEQQPSNPTYSPLLLRTAGRAGLGLPVWALPPERWDTGVLAEATYAVMDTRPYLEQRLPNQQVMDLQQTLTHIVQLDRMDQTLTMTILEMIELAANTQFVHHDEGIPLAIDRFSDQKFVDRDMLQDLLVTLGDVVAGLGRSLLGRAVEPPVDPAH